MAATATNPGVAANESGRFRLWMAAAFFTIYFVWGTTYLAIRYAVETIPPIVTAGLRHTTAGLILLALAWSHGFRPRREHWIAGAVLGALFFLIGHGTLHWAEQHVSSGFAALLVASEPLWILLIGAGMRQQRINWLNGLGLLIGMAGVAAFAVSAAATPPGVTITATRRPMRSLANSGRRPLSPCPQRYSIATLRPST